MSAAQPNIILVNANPASGEFASTVFTVIWIILIIIGIFQIVMNFYFNSQIDKIRSWPRTNATITEAKIKNNIGSSTYNTDVTYEYTVNGQKFHSSSIHPSCDCVVDADIAKSLLIGSTVSIYYNPFNPGDSYITPGGKKYFYYISGILWILIGIWGLTYFNSMF